MCWVLGADTPAALIAKHGKGMAVDAVIELVMSGSAMRATISDSSGAVNVMLNLAGVQSPSMGRRVRAAQRSMAHAHLLMHGSLAGMQAE